MRRLSTQLSDTSLTIVFLYSARTLSRRRGKIRSVAVGDKLVQPSSSLGSQWQACNSKQRSGQIPEKRNGTAFCLGRLYEPNWAFAWADWGPISNGSPWFRSPMFVLWKLHFLSVHKTYSYTSKNFPDMPIIPLTVNLQWYIHMLTFIHQEEQLNTELIDPWK